MIDFEKAGRIAVHVVMFTIVVAICSAIGYAVGLMLSDPMAWACAGGFTGVILWLEWRDG